MQLEEHIIIGQAEAYERKVWYLPCAGQPERFCIFLDGEHYVKHMEALSILIDLQTQQHIPPVECLFVSHVDSLTRQQDFICNPRYAAYVARDLVTWMEERSSIESGRNHFIGGTSLSGLQAAYTALHYPQTFSHTLCQSGSLWWNDEWLTGHLSNLPVVHNKHWISVGDKETASGIVHPPTGLRQDVDQITACKRFAAAHGQRGTPTRFHLYEGGHDPKAWNAELPQALHWLLGTGGESQEG